MSGYTTYSARTGWGMMSRDYMGFRELAQQDEERIQKALTTGEGIVTAGTTGGEALRMQFLHKTLELVSFSQNDAKLMKIIPKKKVPNNTIEWTDFNSYGSEGDGFVYETGADGNFGVGGADDNFSRQVQTIKYMATSRTVSVVSGSVQNIENPMQASETGATLELISKMNLAGYNGDSTLSDNQFNGIKAQIKYWVNQYPSDSKILWDAQGQQLSRELMEDVTRDVQLLYGDPSLLLSSVRAKADFQKLLYPNERYIAGTNPKYTGVDINKFVGNDGVILRLESDKMLRAGEPMVADGIGVDALPRNVNTTAAGALAFTVTPFVSVGAQSPGTGNYYNNVNLNTDTSALGTAPALPSNGYGGNAQNNMPAGNYYYALSAVYGGKESTAWVFGAASAGIITAATVTAPTLGQINKIIVDAATPCIAGLGSTISRKLVKWRLYRYGGASAAAPTSLNQFTFLCDIGTPTSGNPTGFDNGMYIPGTDNAYVITEKKNGSDGWFLAQLLPLMKRNMPHLAMADLFVLLAFVTPILFVPRHHIWIRNIGFAASNYSY